jgi:glycosyltransferase involved in cell wall biosynthesis
MTSLTPAARADAITDRTNPVELDVSVVMPCLNEETTLAACIGRARELLDELQRRSGYIGEIVVADNGSTDRSIEIATALGARVVGVEERGYGNALIGGLASARGRILVMGDTDGSHDFLEAVPLLEKIAAGDDLCLGSRIRGRILPGAMPWKNRWIGNPALTGILNILFRAGVSDAHCGLRALTKTCFERLRLNSHGMEFASEMVVKAALLGLRISECPITLHPAGRCRPPHLRAWRDGWRHLRYLFMLSPTWLFLGPAAVFGTLGLVIFAALLSQPGKQMVELAGLRFGDHWMIVAGVLLTISHQTALFGLASLIYSVREGFRKPRPVHATILRAVRLEFMLIYSAFLIVCGATLLAWILHRWAEGGFGALSAVRELVGATTLLGIGLQNFFGGFLLSIVAGNEARPEMLVPPGDR